MKKQTTLTIALISLSVSILLTIVTVVITRQIEDHRRRTLIDIAQIHYTQEKVTFCHDHTIAPCDDATITQWNETHDDTQFTIKDFRSITEDGIELYNVERSK